MPAGMPHTLFPTAFGTCGLAWNRAGLAGFQLPEEDVAATERRLAQRARTTPAAEPRPEWVRRLVEQVQAHLEGRPHDFRDVPLDWSLVSAFQEAVYRRTREIPAGAKRSYGEVARLLDLGPAAARAVGVALATNPWPLIVPCHRIVAADGRMTGFSAPGGVRTKTRLLALEGAELLSE